MERKILIDFPRDRRTYAQGADAQGKKINYTYVIWKAVHKKCETSELIKLCNLIVRNSLKDC